MSIPQYQRDRIKYSTELFKFIYNEISEDWTTEEEKLECLIPAATLTLIEILAQISERE